MGLKKLLFKDTQWYKDQKRKKYYKDLDKIGQEELIRRSFKWWYGRDIDLENPQTMNEKIMWLKLHDHRDFCTQCADKYESRKYWAQFGEDGLIPLPFTTTKAKDLKPENIPDYPVIVKTNHGSGGHEIIRDKSKVDWVNLRKRMQEALKENYYYRAQEWNYKNIKPRIIVEKLLLDKNGKLPNDYKLHYFNGKLEFIYCSIDREGANYRNIYSTDWKKLPFEWIDKPKLEAKSDTSGPDIPPPPTLPRMIEIGNEIAKNFDYVRVDFYDVDGKLYYGEITLYHGAGFDLFRPEKYDLIYGQKLHLTKKSS